PTTGNGLWSSVCQRSHGSKRPIPKTSISIFKMNTGRSAALSVKDLEHVLDSFLHRTNIAAHNKEELRKCGITHVLNAAHNTWGSKGNQPFYGTEIQYHGIAAEDSPDFDISIYFNPASEFIHKALSIPNGKILVHCMLGKSRSAALVLAYLMIYQNFTLIEAVEKVLQKRAISPNRGFLKQLQDLDQKLQLESR
uniref:Dual specificity protein phosphatase n=1 Tax=Salvator merianae TaxID=96440 RepID=A0A8D0B5S3_SALMN